MSLGNWLTRAHELNGYCRSARWHYARLERHWFSLDLADVRRGTEADLIALQWFLKRGQNSSNPWGRPNRGERRGTFWETVNQICTDRLALMARERDRNEIPDGANYRAVNRPMMATTRKEFSHDAV